MSNLALKFAIPERYKVKPPCTVEIEGGIKIHIDASSNITIEGHNNIKLHCNNNFDIDAKNIRMNAQEDIWIGSGNNSVIQSPRVDINPEYDNSGYKGKK